MAINWRRRASVIRLLAAVYAELGEEAFNGRYSRIAKLYGNEATYDAIKSLFAREVVTMAEDLKTRNLNSCDGCNQGVVRQRARAVPRVQRIELDDSDNEIIITGERPLQVQQQNLQQGQITTDDRRFSELSDDELNLSRSVPQFHHINAAALESSTIARPDTSREKQKHEANSRKLATSRKRSYSAFQEGNAAPSSFGYVTNNGKHRCLLCMTELSSAELLRKHESMSKLHLTNLKDPKILSQGYMMLGQAQFLANTTSFLQNYDQTEPLMSGALNERSETMFMEQINSRSNSHLPPTHASMGISEARESVGREVLQAVGDTRMDMNQHGHGPDENMESSDGNSRPALELSPSITPTIEERVPRAQTVPTELSATLEPQLQTNTRGGSAAPESTMTKGVPHDIFDVGEVEDGKLAQAVQFFLSRGIELVTKQCLEEHPELRNEFLKRVKETQRDVGEGTKSHG